MTSTRDFHIGVWPGRVYDLSNPRSEDVDFALIATRLSRINRFVGGTSSAYSVAQHCVMAVDRVSKPAKPYALLHDAHEAYTGDITRPMEKLLTHIVGRDQFGVSPFKTALDSIKESHDEAIHVAAGLAWPPAADIAAEVKAIDDSLCANELAVLTAYPPLVQDTNVIRFPIRVYSENRSCEEWLQTFVYLTGNEVA